MKTITEKERPIINACLEATHNLLTNYWGDIVRVRDSKDMLVAITMSYKIDCREESPVVKIKMGFSRRYSDVSEVTIDLGQTEFPFLHEV
jgi:hypothetical protein